MFNENRGCIEIGMIYYGCKVDKRLMKTEVVLKWFVCGCGCGCGSGLMKTEVVLKCVNN